MFTNDMIADVLKNNTSKNAKNGNSPTSSSNLTTKTERENMSSSKPASSSSVVLGVVNNTVLANMLPYGDYVLIDMRSLEEFHSERVFGSIHCPVPWTHDKRFDVSLGWIMKHIIAQEHHEKFSWLRTLHVILAGNKKSDKWLRYFCKLLSRETMAFPPLYVKMPSLKKQYPLLFVQGLLPSASFRKFRYPSEIVDDFLWLSNAQSAHDTILLHSLGITHIVNATNRCESNKFADEIEYFNVDLVDEEFEDISRYFTPTEAFIDHAKARNGRVLVHCHAGISRSAALVINYIRHFKRMSLSNAYAYVRERRPEVHPNHSFMMQLLQHERKWSPNGHGSLSETDLTPDGGLVRDRLSSKFLVPRIEVENDFYSSCNVS